MEAGLEHLGRASAQNVDAMVIVVEPGMRSVRTAREVARMAGTLGIPRVFAVCNRVRNSAEEDTVRAALEGIQVVGVLPYDEEVFRSDLEGRSPFEKPGPFLDRLTSIFDALEREVERTGAEGKQ
jgi:CO dehydrogenase maturation factor